MLSFPGGETVAGTLVTQEPDPDELPEGTMASGRDGAFLPDVQDATLATQYRQDTSVNFIQGLQGSARLATAPAVEPWLLVDLKLVDAEG